MDPRASAFVPGVFALADLEASSAPRRPQNVPRATNSAQSGRNGGRGGAHDRGPKNSRNRNRNGKNNNSNETNAPASIGTAHANTLGSTAVSSSSSSSSPPPLHESARGQRGRGRGVRGRSPEPRNSANGKKESKIKEVRILKRNGSDEDDEKEKKDESEIQIADANAASYLSHHETQGEEIPRSNNHLTFGGGRREYKAATRHRGRVDDDGGPPRRMREKKSANLRAFGSNSDKNYDEDVIEEAPKAASSSELPKSRQKLSELTKGQSDLAVRLITQVVQQTYECMVCVEFIGRNAQIWTCSHCFHFFHVACIRKWRASSLSGREWKCPACRHPNTDEPAPSCFCGRVSAPPRNAYSMSHSCGDVCGRARPFGCPHPCPLLCHPGPCPDCTALGPSLSCHCGKSSQVQLCGRPQTPFACGQTCGRSLPCGRHSCASLCHEGPCEPCTEKLDLRCFCGRDAGERACCATSILDLSHGVSDPRGFSCGNVCEQPLVCGNHTCQSVCHASLDPDTPTCPPCERLPDLAKTCACGSTSADEFPKRTSCLDSIPTCGKPCPKLRPCGRHACLKPCHEGSCEQTCSEIVEIACRCGNVRGTVKKRCDEAGPNPEPATCGRVCRAQRTCGRHQCGMKCCVATEHPCPLVCGRHLPCGAHSCLLNCHRGRCPPCLEATFDDRVCPCGRTVHAAPITCGSRPPVCPFACIKEPACGHPRVDHPCHWEGSCPPCPMLVTRTCAGGHVRMKAIPCSQTVLTCGRTCGHSLRCGEHKCTRKCHYGVCEVDANGDALPEISELDSADLHNLAKLSCGQRCNRQLLTCRHLCPQPCHPGTDCPVDVCRQKSKISCSCGRLSSMVPCIGFEDRQLACDDQCAKELRQQRLAEALNIAPTSKTPTYNDFLIPVYRSTPRFIDGLENTFAQFVKVPTMRMQLPVMDNIQRRVVHELARYYLIDTESVGKEPVRYIQLTKRQASRVPVVPLSQYVAIHDSVPPPRALSTSSSSSSSRTPSYPTIATATTLHIYELSPKVTTGHLRSFLAPYEGGYVLHWVDDANALVIFRDATDAYKALQSLSSGAFKIKPYQDVNPSGDSDGNLVLGASTGTLRSSNSRTPPPKVEEFVPARSVRRFGVPAKKVEDEKVSQVKNSFAGLEVDESSSRSLWEKFADEKKELDKELVEKDERDERNDGAAAEDWEDLANE